MAAEWLGVRLRNGEIRPLPHPLEDRALKELGFTWEDSMREGRLLRFDALACDRCLAVTDLERGTARVPQQTTPWWARISLVGAAAALVAAIPLILAEAEVTLGWGLLMVPGYLIIALFVWAGLAGSVTERVRAHRLAHPLPPSEVPCQRCDVGRLYQLELVRDRVFDCPTCGARAYGFAFRGVS